MRAHHSVGLRRRAAAALFLFKPKVTTMSQTNGLSPLGARCRFGLSRVACVLLVFFVVSERRVQAEPPAVIAPPPGPEDPCVVEHTVVYDEPGRYAGWPANGGAWVWGNEVAVAFECGWFKDRPDEADGHARDTDRSNEDIVARSRDGGRTWSHEVHNLLSSDDNMTESPGALDWAHPGFAFKCQGERFYYSYDRAQTWKGPHRLRIPGLMGGDDDLESRTAYIVNGSRDAFLFLGVEPKGGAGPGVRDPDDERREDVRLCQLDFAQPERRPEGRALGGLLWHSHHEWPPARCASSQDQPALRCREKAQLDRCLRVSG